MKKVLVTGIGGVVGQGILRNIRSMKRDIELIGTNVTRVSAGNYLCDRVYEVPYAYDDDYVRAIRGVVEAENIQLIIPSTDYESYYLAAGFNQLQCVVAASPAHITRMCLDKYRNSQAFAQLGIPFASSVLPSDYKGAFPSYVVKPREGRGSRNIHVNPPDLSGFDDSYVIQEYLSGPELTTTAYVTRNRELHGMITFVRELEAGNTARCEVVFDYDSQLLHLVNEVLKNFNFTGSFNIQSRVTERGIVPFEINCRISGTNSVRSQFGFNDVAFTIQEYLYGEQPEIARVTKGAALRVILDIVYPGSKLSDINNVNDRFYIN